MSLTEGLRAGAAEAYGRLYDEHAVRLFGYCRAMVGDEAADTVQDTFAAAVRHAGSVPSGDEDVPVWLYALARSECVRRGALERKPPVAPIEDPVERAVSRLRPEHREVLVLSGVLGIREIARVIGVAKDTAELLTSMACRRLEQATASALGGSTRRDRGMAHTVAMGDVVAALGSGDLHRLVARGDGPPSCLREQVLSACGAGEPRGTMPSGMDGVTVPLDTLPTQATHVTQPISKADGAARDGAAPGDADGTGTRAGRAARPQSADSAAGHQRKKVPFRTRHRDGLVEFLGLAACVAVAGGVLVLWPSPHTSGTSNLDGTSLLIHRGSPVGRLLKDAAGVQTAPQGTSTSLTGPAASPTSKSTSAPAAGSAPTVSRTGGAPASRPLHVAPNPSPSPSGAPGNTPAPTPTPTPTDAESSPPTTTPTPDPSDS